MSPLSSALSKRSAARVAVILLLALVSLAFVLEGSQPAHSHGAGQVGFYNAECPLAALTAVHAVGALPAPPASAWVPLLAFGVFLPMPRGLAVALVRSAHPRAPPLP